MTLQLAGRDMKPPEATIIGTCLADILDGRSWIQNASSSETTNGKNDVELWSELTALVTAIPCHVARDGAIPLRCEVRATAAAT
jgi:hypothetical protein